MKSFTKHLLRTIVWREVSTIGILKISNLLRDCLWYIVLAGAEATHGDGDLAWIIAVLQTTCMTSDKFLNLLVSVSLPIKWDYKTFLGKLLRGLNKVDKVKHPILANTILIKFKIQTLYEFSNDCSLEKAKKELASSTKARGPHSKTKHPEPPSWLVWYLTCLWAKTTILTLTGNNSITHVCAYVCTMLPHSRPLFSPSSTDSLVVTGLSWDPVLLFGSDIIVFNPPYL